MDMKLNDKSKAGAGNFSETPRVVPAGPLKKFTAQVFEACGSPAEEAQVIADHLVMASLMRYESHGIIRIPLYVEWVHKKVVQPGAPTSILKETEATAVVDCGWNFGQVGASRATTLAMEKARKSGIACVVTNRCCHVGRLGAYTEMAARNGFLAIAVCNSAKNGHFVPPWGGREGRLATNPISFAVPDDSGGKIILSDFSTAETSEGYIQVYQNSGKLLPDGWIVDSQGRPSNNPDDFYGPPRGAILPFGGQKGYRGYALGLLAEILGGLLGGSQSSENQGRNGFTLIAIDVSAFLPRSEFQSLVHDLRLYLKSSAPAPGFTEVLVPGELDFRIRDERLSDGIPVDETTWGKIGRAAASVGVEWKL